MQVQRQRGSCGRCSGGATAAVPFHTQIYALVGAAGVRLVVGTLAQVLTKGPLLMFLLVCTDADHNLYIFKGNHYWLVSKRGNATEPQPLQTRWAGLPAGIDAATWSEADGKFYFFKGNET